jgi:hypothetical protein
MNTLAAVMERIDRIAVFLLAFLYTAWQLTQWEALSLAVGGMGFIVIALLLRHLKGMTLWLTVFFLAGGALFMLWQQADAPYWLEAASLNVTLVTLFVFAPLFGIPVRLPEYARALERFYETNVRSKTAMFAGTQTLTQIMGAFINVGSIPVVYHIAFVKPQAGFSRMLADAINRGFGGAIFWSPYFAAMALVTSALSLRWSTLLPYLPVLAGLNILASLLVDAKGLRRVERTVLEREGTDGGTEAASKRSEKGSKAGFPTGLAFYLVAAILIIVLMERWIELPMVLITCAAAAVFPLIWCAAKKEMPTFRQGLKNHITVTLPALRKEMTLFLAAGFFSGAVGATGFGVYIPALLESFPLPVALTFSIFSVLLIAGTSIAGLHPIVPVAILANGIDPASMQITPVYFALLLLGSWGLSNTISPVSAVNNLLAGLTKLPVFELAKANYKFAACMGGLLLLYLSLLRF